MTNEEVDNLPAALKKELKLLGITADKPTEATGEKTSEFLKRTHTDGIDVVVTSVRYSGSGDFEGAVIQIENSKVVGETRFGSTTIGGETISQVLNTDTYDHAREGLGEERLRIVNEYSKAKFGMSITSMGVTGVTRSHNAEGLWRKLMAAGLAEERTLKSGTKIYSML